MKLLPRLLGPLAFFSLFAVLFIACADNGDPIAPTPVTSDAATLDAGKTSSSSGGDSSSSTTDSGTTSSSSGDTGTVDTGPPDTTPPGKIIGLAGTPKTHAAVDLTWNAPADDPIASTGTVAGYDLRFSKTPITTIPEFLAATSATAPAPLPPGQMQTATVSGLDPATLYHFVIRARDAAGNFSDLSNDATVTTKGRAKLLLTEVAIANTTAEGFDFVEAVVTVAGSAEGIQFKQFGTVLHSLAAIDLAVDDHVVVHITQLPGPAGFAQEDTTKDKTSSTAAIASTTAFDVYSATDTLTGTDNLITINDGTAVLDAVAISNRDNDAATATMTAWAAAGTQSQWTFGAPPVDGTNDCASQRDAVNITTAESDPACGGFATGYVKGMSINRIVGAVDTNGKGDWFVAAQSPGAASAATPTPPIAIGGVATSATSVDIAFDHDMDSATAIAASFTIAGLTVSAATVTGNVITLTTTAQTGGVYTVAIANTVKGANGIAVANGATARFCGFTTLPALVTINEVSPNLDNGADLVELKVTRDGPLVGYTLRVNPSTASPSGTLLATLPAICGVTNDIIVVHLTAPATAATETASKNESPTATFAANYDTAYDVVGSNTGIGFSNQVLAIRNAHALPVYIDAAVFSDTTTASSAGFLASVPYVQGLGLWLPADCGGATCTDATTPTIRGIAANWTGVSSDLPTNPSIGRAAAAAQAASWVVGPSTFGN